jgi:type IV secretion system protein VirB9
MSRLQHYCCVVLLSLAASVSMPALAQVIVEYEYQPNKIYEVRTGLGIMTQIELDPNENIVDYSTGFSSGWELARSNNVFYLKPKNVDVDTNMVVRTSTNSYLFELKVVTTDWTSLEQAKRAGVHYKVTFTYPGGSSFLPDETEVVEETRQQTEIETAIAKDRAYNFNYAFSTRTKNKWLLPVNVYDDGQFTYVKLTDLKQFPTGNFPAIFGRERESGEDFVVNTTVENNTIVVHGIYPFLVIRHGKNVVGLRRNKQK